MLVYFLENFNSFFDIYKEIIPRVLFFHACMSFIIGTTVLDSIAVRYDSKYGIIIGPTGTLVAGILVMFLAAFVVVCTNEYLLLLPVSLFFIFAAGQARAVNHMYSRTWNVFMVCVYVAGLIGLAVNADAIDETVDALFRYYEIARHHPSGLRETYLSQKGGFFYRPELSIAMFAAMGTFLVSSPPRFDITGARGHVVV
jgi:hypothetical protein